MDRAKRAINDVFSDISVSREETARRLKELRDEIDGNLECLRDDGVDVDSA